MGREVIWKLLEDTWTNTGLPWNRPEWGTALGAACARLESEAGERNLPGEALWIILVSESIYLIWRLRCERVIQNDGAEFSKHEVTRRWYAAIDQRLDLDRRACAAYLGRSALKPAMIACIWEPIVHARGGLPQNWVTDSGVLVGIKRGRRRRQGNLPLDEAPDY